MWLLERSSPSFYAVFLLVLVSILLSLGIPDEADRLQGICLVPCHARFLSIIHEFVVAALSMDPETFKRRDRTRDKI